MGKTIKKKNVIKSKTTEQVFQKKKIKGSNFKQLKKRVENQRVHIYTSCHSIQKPEREMRTQSRDQTEEIKKGQKRLLEKK